MIKKRTKLPNFNRVDETTASALEYIKATRELRIMPTTFECYRLLMNDDREHRVHSALMELRDLLNPPEPKPGDAIL